MEEIFIKKRIYELTKMDHLDSASNKLLLQQYHLDKQNSIPPDKSEARELLIMGNEKLVFRIICDTFGIYELSKDIDEYSVGMIGLVKAVDTFDINRDVAFTTYAVQVIINEIRMEYRKRKKYYTVQNKTTSIYETVGESKEGDIFLLEDFLGEFDDTIECIIHNENMQTIQANLQYLNNAERVAVIYGYGLFGNPKLTQKEIGDIIGANQGYVSKAMRTGYNKLRILSTANSELMLEDIELKQKLLRQGKNDGGNTTKQVFRKC